MARRPEDCYVAVTVTAAHKLPLNLACSASIAAIAAFAVLLWSCGSDPEPASTADTGSAADTGSSTSSGGSAFNTDTGASSSGGDAAKTGGSADAGCKSAAKTCKDAATLAVCNEGGGFDFVTCGAGTVCHDAACHNIVCKPNEKKCSSDVGARLVCNKHGTTFEKKPCSKTETCFEGTCKVHICKPGKKICGTAKSVKTCHEDGLFYTESACKDGGDGSKPQSCDPAYGTPGAQAFCADQVCKPLGLFCADNQARKCSENGLESALSDNCNQEAASGAPRICKDGKCIELKCKPGTTACLSWASVGKCLADGQKWKKVPCGQGAVCQGGQCVSLACPPSKAFCVGDTVKKCNAFGTGSAFVIDCSSSGQKCFKGGCSKVICKAGASKCGAGGAVVQKCGANGYEFVSTPCGPAHICLAKTATAASCVQKVCEPAAKFCDGKQPKQCNGYGTASVVLPACTGGTFCHGGTCKKKVCKPGELKCKDAGTLEQCNTLGVGWQVVGCGAGQVCGGNKCAKKICEPGKAHCDGTVAKGCDKTGLKYAFQKDCAKDGKNCSNGNCLAKYCGDGTCDKPAESCVNCQKDCGKCPPTGCEALPTAGCSGCACEACVCQKWNANCCSQVWDGLCGQICKNQCGATCKN